MIYTEDLNNAHSDMFANDDGGFGDDDDVLMDMPDFTIGDDNHLNAQDLFHEELLTQAVAPRNQQPSLLVVDNGMGNVSNIPLQLDPNGIPIHDQNIEFVAGQNNASGIGEMGVRPLLNNSMHFAMNNDTILNNLQLEQEQHGQIHHRGIFQPGVMNVPEMGQLYSKLENADFESVTTFFDTKKQGNWAGPDQWYHRRYQLTLQQNVTNKSRSKSPSKRSRQQSADGSNSISPDNENENKKRKRGERKNTKFDFLSIAQGNLIDIEEFAEPQRADNCLTEAVLNKNRKTYHTLPKDLQIKPDIFVKLFHRPNYSVWKHWLNQHAMRMRTIRENAAQQQQENGDGDAMMMDNNNQEGMDGMTCLPDGMGMGDDADDAYQMNMSMMNMSMMNAHKAVIDQNDKDFDNEFGGNDPMDISNFVGNDDAENQNYYDFNLNGYDLVEMDSSKKVEKIKVEFATKAKKVNVRKLKGKLWEKIHSDLPDREKSMDSNKENDSNKSNKAGVDDDDDNDIDMDNNGDNNNGNGNGDDEKKNIMELVTFQDTLDTLPSTISSSISIHMCFICLLHLANEKELQFVPNEDKNNELDRGNFEIQYASENSLFEKEARKINPVVVLGMQ